MQPQMHSIETIRATLRRRVSTTSLRGIAREVGMSPTGLSNFLGGTEPHHGTVGKLEEWYLEHAGVDDDQTATRAATALRMLTSHLPAERARVAETMILDVIAQISEGIDLPWLEEFRIRQEARSAGPDSD